MDATKKNTLTAPPRAYFGFLRADRRRDDACAAENAGGPRHSAERWRNGIWAA